MKRLETIFITLVLLRAVSYQKLATESRGRNLVAWMQTEQNNITSSGHAA
jgi:hypothetical protein